jgi:hypothetical protein
LLKESLQGEYGWDGVTFVREAWLLKQNPALAEAFCPTGRGGKIDNSCAPKKGKVNAKVLSWAKNKFGSDEKAQNFAEWFGDSKVVDSEGNPLTVYHGTSSAFDEFLGSGKQSGAVLGYGNYFTTDPERAARYAGLQSGANIKPVFLSIANPMDLNGRLTDEEAEKIGEELSRISKTKNLLMSPRKESDVLSKDDAMKFWDDKTAEWKQLGDGIERTKPRIIPVGKQFKIEYSDSSSVSVSRDAAQAFRDIYSIVGPDSSTVLMNSGFDGVKRDDEHVSFRGNQIKSAIGNKGTFNPASNKITESLSGRQQEMLNRWKDYP